jgi:hypothetical protein
MSTKALYKYTCSGKVSHLGYRHARHSGVAVFTFTGKTLLVEEPALFNSLADRFLASVDSGRWGSWKAAA